MLVPFSFRLVYFTVFICGLIKIMKLREFYISSKWFDLIEYDGDTFCVPVNLKLDLDDIKDFEENAVQQSFDHIFHGITPKITPDVRVTKVNKTKFIIEFDEDLFR